MDSIALNLFTHRISAVCEHNRRCPSRNRILAKYSQPIGLPAPWGIAGGQVAAIGGLNGKPLCGKSRFSVEPGDRATIKAGGSFGKPQL